MARLTSISAPALAYNILSDVSCQPATETEKEASIMVKYEGNGIYLKTNKLSTDKTNSKNSDTIYATLDKDQEMYYVSDNQYLTPLSNNQFQMVKKVT